MPVVPTVNDLNQNRYFDLFSKLLNDRIILITEGIDEYLMGIVIGQLLYLDAKDESEPISIYISSSDGSVMSALAIVDTMNLIKAPIHTYALGLVGSVASLIFVTGAIRNILPHSQLLLHQPLNQTRGQASDIEIHAKNMVKLKEKIVKLIADKTGKSEKIIHKEIDRDRFFDANEAVEFNLADNIIVSLKG
jgi:ATP-dependent Clp protease protease subunit